MNSGRIIFLNGTSSSGKTTIATALHEKLPEPYMYVSVDGFIRLYQERILKPTNQEELDIIRGLIPGAVSGMQRSVAALAKTGNNLIVDHVLERPEWLRECLEEYIGLDVLFVGVKCPLDVLEQREADRKDRAIGLAKAQFDRVHAHDLYDVEVDTSILNPEECVKRVMEALNHKQSPQAFEKLRQYFKL